MNHDSSGSSNRVILTVLCLVLFITFLDTTIVSVTLGDIQLDLHAGVAQLQWVINGYALPFASLMLLAGNLADRFGRKKLLILGLAIFTLGSLLAALAPNPDILIFARAIMGVGAAASEPGTLSIIRHVYEDQNERAKSTGIWAAVAGLALACGPVLGGILTDAGSWRYVFWFNFILGIFLVMLALRTIPESFDKSDSKLDIKGFFTATAALSAVTFAIILGESSGYINSLTIGLFAASAVFALSFIVTEKKSQNPMLPTAYFRNSSFSGSLFVSLTLFFGIFAIFFFTALYLEEVLNYSGYRIAIDFLPMTCLMILSSLTTGRKIGKYGYKLFIVGGCLIAGVGTLLSMGALKSAIPSSMLPWYLGLAGMGFGSAVVPAVLVVLDMVPPEHSSMAASSANTSRELGSVLGVAILGSLVNGNLGTYLLHRLNALKIPSVFQLLVLNALETGNIPKNTYADQSLYGKIVTKVIIAAYGAFREGLHYALLSAGIILLVSAVVSYLAIKNDAG
ncbi:MAG: MFS transporter [Firmicutes bacterium]|nr:MFS transporter [Bacillota bacterium]